MPATISGVLTTASSPASVPFASAVPAGALLVLTVADEYSYGITITSITDSKGNTYTMDVGGDTVTWAFHSLITTPLTTSDHLIITFTGDTTWTAACVMGQAFSGGVTNTVRVIGDIAFRHQSMDAPLDGAHVGDLVVGFANFYYASALSNPGAPWTPIGQSLDPPSGQVTADWLIASSTATIHYTPAPAAGTGGYDEGVIIAFETTGAVTADGGGGGGGSSAMAAGDHLTGIV